MSHSTITDLDSIQDLSAFADEQIDAVVDSAKTSTLELDQDTVRKGLGQIVAFASLSSPESPEQILHAVASIVPSYMVPKRLLLLEVLPKNLEAICRQKSQTI